jgi:hypothetical protein
MICVYLALNIPRMQYFFSYSRHDSDLVNKLASDLKQRNINVWLDQLDIPPGAKWDSTIEHALDEASGIILVLSGNSVASDNVMDEVAYAIENKKHIIPLLIDDCKVPFRVARIQQINFKDDHHKGIEAIIGTINAHAANPQGEHAAQPASTQAPFPVVSAPQHANTSYTAPVATMPTPPALAPPAPQKKRSWKPFVYGIGATLALLVIIGIALPDDKTATATTPATIDPTDAAAQPNNSKDGSANGGNSTNNTKVTAKDLSMINYVGPNVTGTFTHTGGTAWVEVNNDKQGSEGNDHHFTETGRDEWSVNLTDETRHINLQLNLQKMKVIVNPSDPEPTEAYTITQAVAK